jgi:hypothetical protein
MAEGQMARDQPGGGVDLALAIEGAQEACADVLRPVGKVVAPVALFTGQPGGRYIEVAGEVDPHRPVKHAAGRVDPACPLQRLVTSVGVGEDVEGRLPVGMLAGGAETGNPQRRRLG